MVPNLDDATPQKTTFFGVPTLGRILVDFWLPFGTPLVPFGLLLASFGALLAPFWTLLAPLWALPAPFWTLFGSFCTLWALSWGVLGNIPGFWRRNPQKRSEIDPGHQISYKFSLANCLP